MPVPSKWNMSNAFLNLVTFERSSRFGATQQCNIWIHCTADTCWLTGQCVDNQWTAASSAANPTGSIQNIYLKVSFTLRKYTLFCLPFNNNIYTFLMKREYLKMTEYNNTVMLFIGLFFFWTKKKASNKM